MRKFQPNAYGWAYDKVPEWNSKCQGDQKQRKVWELAQLRKKIRKETKKKMKCSILNRILGQEKIARLKFR